MHLPSEEAGRLLCNQLVGVHVYSRTRACLEDVNDHRIIELPPHYLLTHFDDRLACGPVEESQRDVRSRRGDLYDSNRPHNPSLEASARFEKDPLRPLDIFHFWQDSIRSSLKP